MAPGETTPDFDGLATLLWTDPTLARIREVAGERVVHLVGGAIRDGLLGRPVDDFDLVVEGDPAPLARALDPAATVNERFGTADLILDGVPVDIATARTETYARPGALPDVTPAGFGDDLSRRDFTINAMAMGLEEHAELIDPHGGLGDLASGVIRVLHDRSFEDDPTRAFRAARYAARLGFDLEPRTADLLMGTTTSTVSRDRIETELRLMAAEPEAIEALRLAGVWGLARFEPGRLEVARRAVELLEAGWDDLDRTEVILESTFGSLGYVDDLRPEPPDPWEGYRRARGRDPLELLVARAAGVEWLDEWQREWRGLELEITGADLLAAGLPEGPGIGAGLDAAREARLTGRAHGADEELAAALAAARERS